MPKIRRGNYVFLAWIGDHGRHVHVYRDRKLGREMGSRQLAAYEGKSDRQLEKILGELVREGKL